MRNRRTRCPFICALLACSAAAVAAGFDVVIDKTPDVCRVAFNAMHETRAPGVLASYTLKADLEWKMVSYSLVNGRGERHIVNASMARFDINNDGVAEVVWKESMSLRSQSADILYVFREGSQPSPGSEVSVGERTDWVGVYSAGNSPYISHGFSLGTVDLVLHGGRGYVLLEDAYLGKRKGSSLLIAEYRGRQKNDKDYSSMDNQPTDDLNVICQISQRL